MQIPHLAFPLRFDSNGREVMVEQNSDEEIADNVRIIVSTRRGSRIEVPNFGIRDFVFDQAAPGIAAEHIERAILDFEPRASVLIEEDPSTLSDMMLSVGVTVQEGNNNG